MWFHVIKESLKKLRQLTEIVRGLCRGDYNVEEQNQSKEINTVVTVRILGEEQKE